VLNASWKEFRKYRIELASINPLSHSFDNISAAAHKRPMKATYRIVRAREIVCPLIAN
jgi:hypothetical protein